MTEWLDDAELSSWRAYIEGSQRLVTQLERDLQRECGLSHAEYEVLVRLSEVADHRMRMTQLATQVVSSKSRLTHLVNRMEKAGLVRREVCPTDRRGAFAVLTEQGWEVLRKAAPVHVEGVRQHFVDLLTPEELSTLGSVFATVGRRLAERQG